MSRFGLRRVAAILYHDKKPTISLVCPYLEGVYRQACLRTAHLVLFGSSFRVLHETVCGPRSEMKAPETVVREGRYSRAESPFFKHCYMRSPTNLCPVHARRVMHRHTNERRHSHRFYSRRNRSSKLAAIVYIAKLDESLEQRAQRHTLPNTRQTEVSYPTPQHAIEANCGALPRCSWLQPLSQG